jgi:hypothetical protein
MRTATKLLVAGITLVVTCFISAPAHAVSVTTLSNTNITELQGKIATTVTAATSGKNTTISVEISTNTTGLAPIGIMQFGYNASPAKQASKISGNSTPWTFDGAGTMDGFGSMSDRYSFGGAESGGVSIALGGSGPLVFTLPSTNFVDNDTTHQSTSIALIKFGVDSSGSTSNCSDYISDGASDSIKSDTSCLGTAVVPEPEMLALVGSGLVGLGILVRKRFFTGDGPEIA